MPSRSSDPPSRPTVAAAGWTAWAAAGALLLGGLVAYHNSFSVPFIYDDTPSIVDNPTIRQLRPLTEVLSPPNDSGVTVNARPLVNLSLALNYHFGGISVWGYHAVNVAIHLLAGLTLFGLLRLTFLQSRLQNRFGQAATSLAFTIAMLWTLHPLQTESVTYVIQRAESLAGLFCLLTFYCFVRATHAGATGWWQPLTVLSCAAGMASKEVMVAVPLLVLLYDRTFVGGTFVGALRRHWRLHAGLAATWLLLAYLVLAGGDRGGTAGFGRGVSSWSYLLTQCRAIAHYARLSVWPHPLVFDYGTGLTRRIGEVLPQAAVILAAVGGTAMAVRRWPALGFVAVCFFAILAPSSSVLPVITETMAEHRMYLPLAALIVLGAVGLFAAIGQKSLPLLVALALCLGAVTVRRNADYSSELSIWATAAAAFPDNARAHNNVGEILSRTRHAETEAIAHFHEALRLRPDYLDALCNLASSLIKTGRVPEAVSVLERAFRLKFDFAPVHNGFGSACYAEKKLQLAAAHFAHALRLQPNYPEAHNNLGVALVDLGDVDGAIGHYLRALKLKPAFPDACYNLGNALVRAGRLAEAKTQFELTLRLQPDYAEAHNNLGGLLVRLGALPEALSHFEAAVRLRPDYPDAHNNLGVLLYSSGRRDEAIRQFKEALRIKPDYADARANLVDALQSPPTPPAKP